MIDDRAFVESKVIIKIASMERELPYTEILNYYQPEDCDAPGGQRMEFRLMYQGSLPAAASGKGGSRVKEKHLLRKHFHLQLRELWRQHPDLRNLSEKFFVMRTTPSSLVSHPGPNVQQVLGAMPTDAGAKTWLNHIADNHQRCGGRFVPLVRKAADFTCSLDILFLRRDGPGNLIESGGDIDNRIKVLFDGLRMPETVQEMGGFLIDSDEDPFFCLLPRHYERDRESSKRRAKENPQRHALARCRHGRTLGRIGLATH